MGEIRFVDAPPINPQHMAATDDMATVDQIAEAFRTPLTGAYSWAYHDIDDLVAKLYKLGSIPSTLRRPRRRLSEEPAVVLGSTLASGGIEWLR
jgi:hypothetical protein